MLNDFQIPPNYGIFSLCFFFGLSLRKSAQKNNPKSSLEQAYIIGHTFSQPKESIAQHWKPSNYALVVQGSMYAVYTYTYTFDATKTHPYPFFFQRFSEKIIEVLIVRSLF